MNLDEEWLHYVRLFDAYIKETSASDGFEYRNCIEDEEYKEAILRVVNRPENKLHVCRIMKDGMQIGFVDYICWLNENGKSIIGNFFIEKPYRNNGYGSEVLDLVEKELAKIGAKYIDVTPSKRAVGLYLKHGFFKTDEKSLENGDIAYRKIIN